MIWGENPLFLETSIYRESIPYNIEEALTELLGSARLIIADTILHVSDTSTVLLWLIRYSSSWWFQPLWKILVKLEIFPK